MEEEALVRCNGDTRIEQPEFYGERRATMTGAEGPLNFVHPNRKVRYAMAGDADACRSLSASLGSNKDFSTPYSNAEFSGKPVATMAMEDRRGSHRLDWENKHEVKYNSTLTNLGVEYMKATGTMGVRFKQLQKPSYSKSHDSIACHTNCEPRNSAAGVGNLCSDLPLIIPMTQNQVGPESVKPLYPQRNQVQKSVNPQHHAGYRLGRRKTLAEQRSRVADYSCVFALIGLGLMVVEMECTIADLYAKMDIASYVIKSLITLTTLVLLCLIGVYHAIEVKLFVVDNCIEDWRITMSWKRISQIMLELVICAIHPVPGSYYFNWSIRDSKTPVWISATVPLDVVFSLPMFVRLYLIVRVMLLHSKMFTDASSRSIGALNKITFNTRFVLKTLMNIFPGTVLVVFMLSLWIICAWILRACECWHDQLLKNLLNSLYLVAITFLSVGYGDFVPHTYCGRFVSVLSGLTGAGCTALVVAVIAKKLELTRAEKHVHNFMIENQLSKKLKDAAANVLRETWLIYKYTKLVKRVSNTRVRAHQRKFLQAIHDLRTVKLKQRKLADQANSLTDFAKTTSIILELVSDMKISQSSHDMRMESIERGMNFLQKQMDCLPSAIVQTLYDPDNRSTNSNSGTRNQPERSSNVITEDIPKQEKDPLTIRSRTRGLRHYDMNQNSFESGP